ncbi:MAG: bifunctional DNA-formamidopyrimidine glycosylase/DNA-(apurinic or apyrimidinic site) lyase [Rhizobiaceae bacterium]|nr:bifunctional DNA-formamidopyrimidine glycosylase/DNA-(apurinic or apyrimidinic site) lyase [Rhizobiaceae bacterium]
MPELPEVETVRRGLEPIMLGATITKVAQNRPDLRFPFPDRFVERLEGASINHMGRRAKYLVAELDTGEALVMHLGMSGSFRIELEEAASLPGMFHHPRSEAKAHDHVVFGVKGGTASAQVIYNDPRRFGFMDIVKTSELASCKHFAGMGIEPTGNELNGDTISRLFAGKSTPLKAALLDQRLIAGLGNIYVCEALWRAGLSPRRKASTITRKNGMATERSEALSLHIRDVIAEAIEAGGSSLRDHRQTNGDLGYFQHRFSAYDREGEACSKKGCSGIINRIVQSGRSTFYCPKCQR